MFIKRMALVVVCLCVVAPVYAEPLTLPLSERPQWLRQEGIVMAGSWEPLPFRVRRDGSEGYTPTPEQRAAYLREHGPEMTARLKALGVNFIMMHCYKGAGLEAERQSMAEAVGFAKRYHDAGLRVGVYNYSGAFLWELLFKELPQAEQWVLLDENGNKRTYGRATYRYRWNRNHPDAQAFYRKIVRFAVEEIQADLIHFDNYTYGPGRDANSVQRFREYLRKTFTPEQLNQRGIERLETVQPAMTGPPDDFLRRAWLEFACRSLADSYQDMGRYARSLRKDVLLELNPAGVRSQGIVAPVDHGRLLRRGEAFWDEGRQSGFFNGRLQSRIRTYKVARRMNNMAFTYTITPLEMAESMAFNLDCLGAICWFEYDEIVAKPGSKDPVSPELAPFIRFFHKRGDLLRETKVVADVAILRSFPSQVLTDPKHARLTGSVESQLIENRACFQIIYDRHLEDCSRYRALILAGCVALSDRQIEQIKRYVASGGRLVVAGPVGVYDEWILPRKERPFDDLPDDRVVKVPEDGDVVEAARRACSGGLSLSVKAPAGLCAELTENGSKRMVHLVNYRADEPAKNVIVRLRTPAGRRVKSVMLANPLRQHDVRLPFAEQDEVMTCTLPEVDVYEIVVVTME